jgi:uncharacterized protein
MKIWTLAGVLCLVVAAIGVPLPLLPTTPFVILAAFCFSKSSPRLHAWLLQNRIFGPGLRRWNEQQCIARRSRVMAITMVMVVGGSSVIWFITGFWLSIAGAVLISIGLVSILRLKVCD